jgi:ACS family allantoate permease-like MFS transporter
MASRWKTNEQPLRIAIWYAGSPFGGLIGQAFDYAAVQIKGSYSPWRYIYIILGSITLGYTVLFLILFPDSPMKAKFLTDRERQIAVQRLQTNNTGIQTRKFKKSQVIDAIKDPQLYLITLILFAFAFSNVCIGRFVYS